MLNFNPPKGGRKIPLSVYSSIIQEIVDLEAMRPWSKQFSLRLRFKGQFCYLGASENDQPSFPLGRLRYFDQKNWGLDLYTYSSEKYEPCVFTTGEWYGTLEQVLDICEMYLIA